MPDDQAGHPIDDSLSRRQLVQAGAAGFLGLSMTDVAAWRRGVPRRATADLRRSP